jgi:aspartokinase-like uncharacterized kinase
MVVKVGGSLYDLPDLADRLRQWLARQATRQVLLFPGGGALADVVRDLDRRHRLGEEHSHWLALRALTVNAHFLSAILETAAVVTDLSVCSELWEQGKYAVADPHALAVADEGQPGQLPHSWDVTSDSLAVRAALLLGAGELVLLKSLPLPEGVGWVEASGRGIVDRFFNRIVGPDPWAVRVRLVDFRAQSG